MSSLFAQLKKHNINPKKWLGQNFLLDEETLEQIVEHCQLSTDDLVVEIGAGLGTLTTRLATKAGKVLAVEIDKTLASLLKEEIIKEENVEVINQDILRLDFSWFAKVHGDKIKIVGNIPYNISAPLLFKLFGSKASVSMAVLMFQKEVADRIVARPATKSYGVLSVSSQVSAVVSKVLFVSKHLFYPQPKVDSCLVQFLFPHHPVMNIEDEQVFKRVVKASFAQRRKTLQNALKISLDLDIPFDDLIRAVKDCGIDPQRRGETLSLDEFKNLSNSIARMKTS